MLRAMLVHWLGEVFSYPPPTTMLAIAAKTLVIYAFVVVGLRLTGTRQLGQMTTYDLVLIIVLANAVQNALVAGDDTLVGGLVSAATLLLADQLLTLAVRHSSWLEKEIVGEPCVLLNDGHLHWDRMRKEGVTHEELMAAVRGHGLASLTNVRLAILEVDGNISVVPKDAPSHRTRRHVRGLKVS
jgi:uncharacterized membrane protein YcaP (DUF421 family)